MKRVTKNNILKLIDMQKKYLESGDKKLLQEINNFIENVMNKDKSLFHKLTSYNLLNEELDILFFSGLK